MQSSEPQTSVPIRVLLVEDSEDEAELIRLELRRGSFEPVWRRVDTEPDFLAALEEEWDLILSDYQMPTFDGLRAFRLYRERGLDIPFLFVSGALGEERAVEAMRAGARDYLIKGKLGRLNAAIRRELAEARNRQSQRLAEQSAEREQRRLAMAVEASGAGIFESHVPAGDDTWVGDRFADILGMSREQVARLGDVASWLVAQAHADDSDALDLTMEEFMAGRSDRLAAEVRLPHAKGHWIDVSLFAKAVDRDATGRTSHIVGVIVDVSARRRLEAQFRQAQKMEAVGRLAGGVAHDFNNLLTGILGFAGFALSAIPEDHPAHADIKEVVASAQMAESVTRQLLAFSRNQPISPRVLAINTVVASMDRLLRRLVGEDVDVLTALADDLWNVRMDPGSLEQVLANLAVNARDAMPDGGKLTIETENLRAERPLAIARGVDLPAGEYATLSVSDSGTGMDEETQTRIFEPFFTTKAAGRGTGLGLSTCYGIVKQAGGYIAAYSEIGVGTTFKVYLPRTVAEEEPIDRPALSTRGGRETVLLAEDDARVRVVAERILSEVGYRVVTAADGVEAERAAAALERVDLLLTDVVMPEKGGAELAESLRSTHPGMRVLFMSGYTRQAIEHRGEIDPGTHLVQKPFTPEQLVAKVRELLDAPDA